MQLWKETVELVKMKNIKIYWELMRPFTLLAPAIGFLSGAVMAARSLPAPISFLGALCAVILNGASNVNNQYFDLQIDRINKPHRPLPSGKISPKKAIVWALTLYSVTIFLSYLVNLRFFIIVLAAVFITFFYSAPPFRFKKYGIIANLSIALPRGVLLIVAGWVSVKSSFTIEPWFIGGIFGLFLLGAATTKDFKDIEGDRKYGINTLPVIYGVINTIKIVSPFFVLPFLLVPLGVYFRIIRPTTLPLTGLAVWGAYIIWLMLRKPQDLTFEENHISWKHMYLMLITGQVGFAVSYLI